jgi:1-deoxy-D-xylulose-5-phosphate synthase
VSASSTHAGHSRSTLLLYIWLPATEIAVTVEDGARSGGLGSALTAACADVETATRVRTLGLPSRFLDAGRRADLLAANGLTGPAIAESIQSTLRTTASAELLMLNPTK